ncbi:hypothetical protein PG993_014530 [Apiospora rasikravindrae]|uniref:Uncharacterized protein n=1 Tax=Apiospora rasikravindrae TaxID=990691 RepID=A0ABR1RP41_9PEZI
MLRNPLQSAAARGGRPDLHRVADGIASSLRQFSIAQARCDDEPQRPTGRQRSAAVVKELFSMSQQDRAAQGGNQSSSNGTSSAPTSRGPEAPKVISVGSLRGGTGGRFAGFRKPSDNGSALPPASGAGGNGGNVIRGGLPGSFRGRGGAAGARGGFAGGRGGFVARGGGAGRGRGGAMTGGRGRGGRRRGDDSDDRPSRRNDRANKADEDSYKRFAAKDSEDPDYDAWTEPLECGTVQSYNPAFDLIKDLAGYAPAIASSTTPLAQHATALTQTRILGGGRASSPNDIPWPTDAKKQYTEGHGVFFPSEEAKKFVSRRTEMEFKAPPAETKSAILDAALLGKYEGPKFAQPGDHLGSVKSYVKREGTWNAAAERRIEAKIKSLLPGQQAAAAAARPAPKGKDAKA